MQLLCPLTKLPIFSPVFEFQFLNIECSYLPSGQCISIGFHSWIVTHKSKARILSSYQAVVIITLLLLKLLLS